MRAMVRTYQITMGRAYYKCTLGLSSTSNVTDTRFSCSASRVLKPFYDQLHECRESVALLITKRFSGVAWWICYGDWITEILVAGRTTDEIHRGIMSVAIAGLSLFKLTPTCYTFNNHALRTEYELNRKHTPSLET